MSLHPINLIFRFCLEVMALISFGLWGWNVSEGWLKYIIAFGIPFLMAALWGVFAVPGDASRSGKAPVPTPGVIRLLLEFFFFGFAFWCLQDITLKTESMVYGLAVLVHHILSFDRIIWLLKQK